MMIAFVTTDNDIFSHNNSNEVINFNENRLEISKGGNINGIPHSPLEFQIKDKFSYDGDKLRSL